MREVTDRGAGLDKPHGAVRLGKADHDLAQCRFARPVAPDQAYAFALRNRKFDTIQQWRATEGEADVAELDKGRGHRGRHSGGWRQAQGESYIVRHSQDCAIVLPKSKPGGPI